MKKQTNSKLKKATKKLKTELHALNKYKGFSDYSIDYSTNVTNCDVEVIFRNIKERLISRLNENDTYIIGCVAWLTDFDILDAMKGKSCGILVQKEDFLRPDEWSASNNWKDTLRLKYQNTKCRTISDQHFMEFDFDSKLNEATRYHKMSQYAEIRCAGHNTNNTQEKHYTKPLMHNKFLVFGKLPIKKTLDGDVICEDAGPFEPMEVWTGSFNMSSNASHSLENVVLIKNKEVAIAYSKEWANLYFDSEKLDWTSDWHAPDPNEYTDYT